MIKLQFTMITDRIRNKIRNGNWFPKFSINRKEQKFLPICLRRPQKRMSPPVPQTVVIGKKSIWVTNKINLQ
jgi:hypothetical protein